MLFSCLSHVKIHPCNWCLVSHDSPHSAGIAKEQLITHNPLLARCLLCWKVVELCECVHLHFGGSVLSFDRLVPFFSVPLPSFKLCASVLSLHLWFSTSTLIVLASRESKWKMCYLQTCSSFHPCPCIPPALLVCGFWLCALFCWLPTSNRLTQCNPKIL